MIIESSREIGKVPRERASTVPSVRNLKMMVKLQASHLQLTFRKLLEQINPTRKEKDSLNGN